MESKAHFMMLQLLVMSQPLDEMIEECISELNDYILLKKPIEQFPIMKLYKLLLKVKQVKDKATLHTIMKETDEIGLLMNLADQIDKSSQQ